MKKHAYAIKKIADKREEVAVRLPPEAISVLTQVRGSTFRIDEDLLPSTLAEGQITSGVAAALTREEAARYVEQLNRIFLTTHTERDLTMVDLDGEEYAVILIFGHRRLATVRAINEMIAKGEAKHTENFDGLYRVKLRFGITAEKAIELQFNENRHTVPAPHVEAKKAWGFYRYLQTKNPDLSQAEFARRIGRTAEWVRSAMRFCSLPPTIQAYVDGTNKYGARLPYGVLVHLARLTEGLEELGIDLPEEGQQYWLLTAFTESLDTTKFGKKVSQYLADKKEESRGQLALFDLVPSPEEQQRRTRSVVNETLTRIQWVHNSWLDEVSRLAKGGAFGGDNPLDLLSGKDTFSPGSPIRIIAARLRQLEILLPLLVQLARQNRTGLVRELEAGIPVVQSISEMLEKLMRAEPAEVPAEDAESESLFSE